MRCLTNINTCLTLGRTSSGGRGRGVGRFDATPLEFFFSQFWWGNFLCNAVTFISSSSLPLGNLQCVHCFSTSFDIAMNFILTCRSSHGHWIEFFGLILFFQLSWATFRNYLVTFLIFYYFFITLYFCFITFILS